MRWSIIRLIALREIRDLLRDRRTLFLVLGLPVLLYPIFGAVAFFFAVSLLGQTTVVGVAGLENLPQPQSHPAAAVAGALLLAEADRRFDYPPLIVDGRILPRYLRTEDELGSAVAVRPLESADRAPLDGRKVDAMLVVPPGFAEQLRRGERPKLEVLGREGDETSKLAVKRLLGVLGRWERKVKEVRLARAGLPPDFDDPVEIIDPEEAKPREKRAADEVRDALVKFFPFLLVMWTMAGALHPAIDMTAGEKERGTMETLLISPAERSEVVGGKFLATTAFSYATAVWNVLWMAGGAEAIRWASGMAIVNLSGLAWSVLLALPLAGLFAAVALALGVFARSTKEGQYYLMPLFLVTLPLTFWSMAPGAKLNMVTSFVPVTGMMLLQQQMLSVSPEPGQWLYLFPVLLSLAACVALALAWASSQFRRETVLFREAERFNLAAWLRGLLKSGGREEKG